MSVSVLRALWVGPVTALVLGACASPAVEWSADRSMAHAAATAALTADGVMQTDTLVAFAAGLTPPAPVCPGSVRVARSGRTVFAVWWAPRANSAAHLVAARSPDGGVTWGTVASVDTTDRGASGCRREPPAIAADVSTGYVHVAYALLAPEGPGLFFAHSMDNAVTFHSPVPILYGERLGHTSVAAWGDYVAVAFEDPNSSSPRVGLAVSRTMGHIFEDRLLPVSNDNGVAFLPLVAIRGRRVSVAWQERTAANGDAVFRIRTGTLH